MNKFDVQSTYFLWKQLTCKTEICAACGTNREQIRKKYSY